MAFGNFGSAWREKAFYTDPDERLHVADPAHSRASGDPNPVWIAPPDIHEQPEFLWDSDPEAYVADSTGMVLDTTPYDHNVGGEFDVTREGVETAHANAVTAGTDYGASRQRNYTPPPLQDYTTRYLAPRFEGLDHTPVAPVALIRGLNSYPENNPEGFRRGWVEQTFVDRKFYEGERTHDRRLLTPNLPSFETDQAPVPSTTGSPFASMARSITNINQRPMIRREPPSISESVETDGSDQGYTDGGDWVTG